MKKMLEVTEKQSGTCRLVQAPEGWVVIDDAEQKKSAPQTDEELQEIMADPSIMELTRTHLPVAAATGELSQKEIAQALEAAAARTAAMGGRPASPKQCWYLAGLMLRSGGGGLGEFALNFSIGLSSAQASQRIDALLNN